MQKIGSCAATLLSAMAVAALSLTLTAHVATSTPMTAFGDPAQASSLQVDVAEQYTPDEEAVLRMLRSVLEAAGISDPRFDVKSKNFIQWSSTETPLSGAFSNVRNDNGNTAETLEITIEGAMTGCSGPPVAYDAPAPSNIPDVHSVFSGGQVCPKSKKSVHFVALDFGETLWIFLIQAPEASKALAKLMKQSLRMAFIQ